MIDLIMMNAQLSNKFAKNVSITLLGGEMTMYTVRFFAILF